MQHMSRVQRLLLIYLIWKSHEFEKELWRPRGGAGGTSLRIHGNEYHSPDFEEYGLSLLLDGSRSMTGNINIGDLNANQSLDILFGSQDNALWSYVNKIYFSNKAHTAYAGWVAGTGEFWGRVDFKKADGTISFLIFPASGYMAPGVSPFVFRSAWMNNAVVNFQARDAAAMVTCATLENPANVPQWTIPRAGVIAMLDQKMLTIGTYTDAQRPAAGTVGRVIFNTDDGMPNYDDGVNWRDINGNIT